MGDTNSLELAKRFITVSEFLNRQTYLHRLDEWEDLGMTIPQLRTLFLLEQLGPMRMGSISIHLGRALSATTTVVDRLVEKGYVDRSSDPNDRRVVLCELTESGRSAIDQFWRIDADETEKIIQSLEPAQIATVVRGLELVQQAADEVRQRCAEPGASRN